MVFATLDHREVRKGVLQDQLTNNLDNLPRLHPLRIFRVTGLGKTAFMMLDLVELQSYDVNLKKADLKRYWELFHFFDGKMEASSEECKLCRQHTESMDFHIVIVCPYLMGLRMRFWSQEHVEAEFTYRFYLDK